MADFERTLPFSEWATVRRAQLDKLLKVNHEVRRIVIQARKLISDHMKKFPDCDPDTCGIIRNTKAVAFDQIGEVLKGASEDDN